MKIDIISNPPTQWFGAGEDRFGLQLRRFSGADRAAVIDACASGNVEMQQLSVQRLIDGWDGVCDGAGNPIAFDYEEKGVRKTRIGEFMGAVPLDLQFEILVGLILFLGVPRKLVGLEAALLEMRRLGADAMDPTSTQGGATATPA